MFDTRTRAAARIAQLAPGERARFHAHVFGRVQPSLMTLMFGLPVLFLFGWMREYAIDGIGALSTLPQRVAICGAALLLAGGMLVRRLRRYQHAIGVAYLLVLGIGLAGATLDEPARLSMLHVVVALLLIIWLRFAVHPLAAAGVVAALALPLAMVMARLGSTPDLWAAYAAFCLVGVWIGLAARNASLGSWLELYELRQRLLERLHEDSLTGASNRDAWEAAASHAHRNALRSGQPSSVIFFDLDRFKAINDRYGHATGDAVLQEVSSVMKRNLREGELLARIGGEEFVALLPRVPLRDAVRVAERVRGEVRAMRGTVPVTVSIGVAEAGPEEPLEAVTARADAAMLEAKRAGRDRVEAA
jgi:diguanylate cyclase